MRYFVPLKLKMYFGGHVDLCPFEYNILLLLNSSNVLFIRRNRVQRNNGIITVNTYIGRCWSVIRITYTLLVEELR